uniref:Uncharacterized protein n=1 Tax=Arundo donax TaxID=35708 RepID=A0A0A9EBF4_ARUDO
MRSVRFGKIF